MRLIVVAALLGLLLPWSSTADAAQGSAADTRPCVTGPEYRVLRHHDGANARSWSLEKVQRYIDAAGHREDISGAYVVSWPTCDPCDTQKLVGYFDRFAGERRLIGMSRWNDFVENPPPASCY